ncbi:MAG: hypothetical protein J7J94_02790 [Thaumarchaeota archaeon]|nr:hypothetical protein [Nitrososphaerota archaeon]
MEINAGICGNFPRPPELRKALDELSSGKIDEKELNRVFKLSMRKIVELQEENGLNPVTSGLLLWHDPLRPFAESFSGVQLGGLLRFFDNNFYYRRPIITGPIKREKPITVEEVGELSQIAKTQVKAVLPGPYTFLKLSENKFYQSEDQLIDDLIEALAAEIEDLNGLADIIQVDEPSLVDPELSLEERRKGVEVVKELIGKLRVPSDRLIVATYFNLDPDSYSILLDLKTGLHLDLCSSRDKAEEALREYGFKGSILSLGIVDSRSIFPETPAEMAGKTRKILEKTSAEKVMISTSSWLDYLPFNEAVEKLRILGRTLREVASS